MHGRQKKERSVEEEDAKLKENTKKVSLYQHAMSLIFGKRRKQELDEELLKITGQVLSSNPDIHTLWNIRKEVLTFMKQSDYKFFSDVIVPKELDFAEFCLKANPKSYGAWHHRSWLMKETSFSKVAAELKLLAKYLEYDDRNFHCWDYRRYLLDNCSEVTLDQELEFTTEKISSNFSNFSSWHLRSKILPKIPRDYLEEELELIRNAVFTDPKDQSAWFYHRWLLKSQLQTDSPCLIAAQHRNSSLVLIFGSTSPCPMQSGVKVFSENVELETIKWMNPWSNTCSKLWTCTLPESTNVVSIKGESSIMRDIGSPEVFLKSGETLNKLPNSFDAETSVKTEKLRNLLKDEIRWVQELQELEPDIKWPISTLILLMRMYDFVGYKQDILSYLEMLIRIDSKRLNYYLDLRSKYLIEWKLVECSNSGESFLDLSGLNLTALYYPERICFYKKIRLCNNALKNCEPFRALLSCEDLDASENSLCELNLKAVMLGLHNLKI